MADPHVVVAPVVVGLDNGGTTNNATVMTMDHRFLVPGLLESRSRVLEGTDVAVEALARSFEGALLAAGVSQDAVLAVGLDTPGPAGIDGVICAAGSTNFLHASWRNFNIREALQARLGLPVVYNNDANAAALYAHHRHLGDRADDASSVSVIVGTGLGGGIIHKGMVVKGAAGMAAELGHVPLPMSKVLEVGQPAPLCNCGQDSDAESVASLTALSKNLLPYWFSRFPDHPLASLDLSTAAYRLRSYAERGDALALSVFDQQARAIGTLLTIAAHFLDPDVYFIGGGVVEAEASFRGWFLERVRGYTELRPEQAAIATFCLVPDLDLAGARGSALAAASYAESRPPIT